MSRFYSLEQAPLNSRSSARAIAAANNGLLFDPSDMSTLFQDAEGTIPVTAVEQPVGLILDKSQGLMLGREEVPVDYLSNTTLWSVGNGTSQVSEGKITFTASGGGNLIVIISGSSSGFKQGKYSLTGISPDITIDKYFMGRAIGNNAIVGDQTCVGYQGNTELFAFIVYSPPLGATFSIEHLSVKELYGNHARQSVTASRPTLSARYNLLTKTEDFSNAAWIKNYCTITTNSTTDPFGGNSADTITSTSSSINTFIYQVVAPLVSGAIYTVSRYVKAGSITKCTLGLHQLADIYFDLNTLTYNIIGAGAISASIIDVGDGWRKITGSWQWGSGTVYQVCFAAASTMSSQIGVQVGGALYSFGHSLVLGASSTTYQRVNTATDYDTNPAFFPKYLKFDGIDDYLNLPYMGLYANGSASVIIGIDDRTQSGNARVLSESSSTTSSQYAIRNLTSGGIDSYITDDAGVTFVDSPNTKGIELKNYVFSFIDSGSDIKRYRNSAYENVQSYSRAGKSFTASKTTIGALDTMGAVVAYTAMNLYGLIITKSALTNAQRIKCERLLAQKAGVML